MVMRADGAAPYGLGAEVRLDLDLSQISIFDGATEARL
jgi:hypothetical protein